MPHSAPGIGALNGRPPVGDEHLVGGEGTAFDVEGVAIGKSRSALDDLRPGTFQEVAVDAVETCDLAVLVGDQSGPVESSAAAPSSRSRQASAAAAEKAEA